jgi:hypothetical protein
VLVRAREGGRERHLRKVQVERHSKSAKEYYCLFKEAKCGWERRKN